MHALLKNALAIVAPAALLAGCSKGKPEYLDDQRPDPKPPARGALSELVEAALPELIGDDNRGLVGQLREARLGTPLSQAFDPGKIIAELFEDPEPVYAPACEELRTEAGDPDPGSCSVSSGEVSGRGAFKELRFSKHMGLGTVTFQSREADRELQADELKPVGLSQEEAYQRATRQLVAIFDLPAEEIPEPPDNAKNRFPARNLAVGRGDQSGSKGQIPVKKVVSIQRGLYVGIDRLPWIPAPGRATVVMDDEGASQIMIRNWQELRPHPQLLPENAKSRAELVEEIVEDLLTVNDAPVARMRSRIIFTALPASTYGLMVPTLQVSVSPLPAELSEEQQAKVPTATAGYVREYSLVRLEEGKGE